MTTSAVAACVSAVAIGETLACARGVTPQAVSHQAQAPGKADTALDRPPEANHELVRAQGGLVQVCPRTPILRPPAQDAQSVEGVELPHLESGLVEQRSD